MWDRQLSLPNVWVIPEERLFLDLGMLKTDTCNYLGWLKMSGKKEDLRSMCCPVLWKEIFPLLLRVRMWT